MPDTPVPTTARQADAPSGMVEALDAMRWIFEVVGRRDALPGMEARIVARLLFQFHESGGGAPPIALQRFAHYLPVHSMNVTLLSLELARRLGWSAHARERLATAALLHDIGMAHVPIETLAKPGVLDAAERALIRTHPLVGARLILECGVPLDLSATVAYEHHLSASGGYPPLAYPRAPHVASAIVKICDVYHGLRTPRPFRKPWPSDVAVTFLQQRAGSEFPLRMVSAFGAWLNDDGDPLAIHGETSALPI